MRRLLPLVVILLASSGCGGDDDPASPSIGGSSGLSNGSMSARIDGTSWNANSSISPSYEGGILAVGGEDTGRQTVAFGVTAAGPGTYGTASGHIVIFSLVTVAPGAQAAMWTARPDLAGTNGTVTITSLSNTGASGTFSFVATAIAGTPAAGTKTVTDGVFNVRFNR
jgi:hypothetical protein